MYIWNRKLRLSIAVHTINRQAIAEVRVFTLCQLNLIISLHSIVAYRVVHNAQLF